MVQLICTVVHTVYRWMPSGPGDFMLCLFYLFYVELIVHWRSAVQYGNDKV